MKKFVVAAALLSLTTGAAFAENPYAGRTDVFASGPKAGQPVTDQTITSSIGLKAHSAATNGGTDRIDPADIRFGGRAPNSGR